MSLSQRLAKLGLDGSGMVVRSRRSSTGLPRRLYIGNDSGITHLAAAGVPVVATFGPTDPAVWAPRGERVMVVSGALEEIGVDRVWEAAQSLL